MSIKFSTKCRCGGAFLWEQLSGLIMVIRNSCYQAKCSKCHKHYEVRKP